MVKIFIPSRLRDFSRWEVMYRQNFSTNTEPHAYIWIRTNHHVLCFILWPLGSGKLINILNRGRVKELQGKFPCVHSGKWMKCQPWKFSLPVYTVQIAFIGRYVTLFNAMHISEQIFLIAIHFITASLFS